MVLTPALEVGVSNGVEGVDTGGSEFDVDVSGFVVAVFVSGPAGPVPDPDDGAGVIVSPEPVSQTRPLGSVAIPFVIVVPLANRNVPLL